jgi:hypothetical protein
VPQAPSRPLGVGSMSCSLNVLPFEGGSQEDGVADISLARKAARTLRGASRKFEGPPASISLPPRHAAIANKTRIMVQSPSPLTQPIRP